MIAHHGLIIRPARRSLDARRASDADHHGEYGASAVETAIVMPVLILIFFAIVQGAVTMHAGTIAHATAQSTYEASRLHDATIENALSVGQATATQAGDALQSVEILIDIDADTVTVTVTGVAVSLVPGIPITVERSVTGPREQWV